MRINKTLKKLGGILLILLSGHIIMSIIILIIVLLSFTIIPLFTWNFSASTLLIKNITSLSGIQYINGISLMLTICIASYFLGEELDGRGNVKRG